MSSEIQGSIGRYHIKREIGRGAMGVVYEALDPALDSTVALKTSNVALAAGSEREAFEQRFLTEARIAAGLSHPNIVVVHDMGRDPVSGVLFIALERLQGRTRAEATAGDGSSGARGLRIAGRVADAVHAAHVQGVHRDIRPANIMLLPSGESKLMDFGIARGQAPLGTGKWPPWNRETAEKGPLCRLPSADWKSDYYTGASRFVFVLDGERIQEMRITSA